MTTRRTVLIGLKSLVAMIAMIAASCASSSRRINRLLPTDSLMLRLQHQILFRSGSEEHVFEGYLVLTNQGFYVKAFAGPGIDLFTIKRQRDRQQAKLHIPALADRIDLQAVGGDIARVYLGGCPAAPGKREIKCDFEGEPLIESYDQRGLLTERHFPKAHGIGLDVHYEDYRVDDGYALPQRITLTWRGSANCMVILVVSHEELKTGVDDPLDRLPVMLEN